MARVVPDGVAGSADDGLVGARRRAFEEFAVTRSGEVSPWRSGSFGEPQSGAVERRTLERNAAEVARDLLGCRLASSIGGEPTEVVIVETEAYLGPGDPASHAATKGGQTSRNRVMYGPAGRAYVYLIYGVHWCVNVVTGREGDPQAVLIRGADPLHGVATIRRRRGGRRPLLAGPGRVCEGLGITGSLYGHDLARPPLLLERGWRLPDASVEVSPRIGVTSAADRLLRFSVRGRPGVSR